MAGVAVLITAVRLERPRVVLSAAGAGEAMVAAAVVAARVATGAGGWPKIEPGLSVGGARVVLLGSWGVGVLAEGAA